MSYLPPFPENINLFGREPDPVEHDFWPLAKYLSEVAGDTAGKFVVAAYGKNLETGADIKEVRHVENGPAAAEDMITAAVELAAIPGANVYVLPALMRPDLPDGKKGGIGDVVATLAIVLDFDRHAGPPIDYAERLPTAPHFAVETSPGNFQAWLFFDAPQSPVEVPPILDALVAESGADPSGAEVSHVFRVPGCLNWPNAAKIAEGRSPEPVRAKIVADASWDGEFSLVSLREAIERKWPAAFDRVTRSEKEGREYVEREQKVPVPKAALIEVLGYIPPDCDRKEWVKIIAGIRATRLRDVPPAEMDAELLTVAMEWSCGDYHGGDPPANWHSDDDVTATFRTLPPKPGGTTFGTLYAIAKANGYDKPPPGQTSDERWGHLVKDASESDSDDGDGAEPVDLWNQLTPAPVLTRDMLPPAIAAFAWDNAERLGVEPQMVALPALAACAGALHDDIQIQPREHDTAWSESARLWVAIIAPPGTGKTPAERAALAPLRKIEAEWGGAYQMAKVAFGGLLEEWKARAKERRKADRGADPAEMADDPKPVEPVRRRTLADDFTMEGLAPILADNERGVLIACDELSGVLGSFDAYHGKGVHKDRPAMLRLWNGDPLTIDRASKNYSIRNWGASVVGGIQDSKLCQLAPNLHEDGLFQRFLVCRGRGTGAPIDRKPDEGGIRRYEDVVRRLTGYGAHPIITLSPTAHEYRRRVEKLAHAMAGWPAYPAALRQHMLKIPALFTRLLLALHAIECASAGDAARLSCEVPEATARRAYDLTVQFFIPSAVEIYTALFTAQDEDGKNAKWVAGYILAHRCEQVTERDLYQARKEWRQDRPSLRRAIAILENVAWLVGAGETTWTVNIAVHQRFAERAEQERHRRERVRMEIAANGATIHQAYCDERGSDLDLVANVPCARRGIE